MPESWRPWCTRDGDHLFTITNRRDRRVTILDQQFQIVKIFLISKIKLKNDKNMKKTLSYKYI